MTPAETEAMLRRVVREELNARDDRRARETEERSARSIARVVEMMRQRPPADATK